MYVWRQFFFAIPILGVALVFLDSFFFLFFVSLPIPRKAVFPTDLYWLTCLYDTYDLMVNIKYYDIYATCSTSRAARGDGGSFKNIKPIGNIRCCESQMSDQKH